MKYFVAALCLLAASVPIHAQSMPELLRAARECKTQSGAAEDAMTQLKRGQIPASKQGQCMMACICKKFGVMGANNIMDTTNAQNLLVSSLRVPRDKASNAVNQCKAEEKPQTDECEAAKIMATCIIGKARQ